MRTISQVDSASNARLFAAAMLLVARRASGFDPDQPRDETGKWTSVYHGTAQASLKGIFKRGLRKEFAGQVWEGTKAGRVFVTPELSIAQEYAQKAADQLTGGGHIMSPAVLRIEVPEDARKDFVPDRHVGQTGTAFEFDGDIPPEWIKEAWVREGPYLHPREHPLPWVKVLAGNRTYYVAILLRNDLRAAYSPDQPRDEAGRWTDVPSGIVEAIKHADGGFTYSAVTGQSPTRGYALSIHPDREKVLDAKDADVVALATYAAANWDLLKQSGKYLGGWHNPADHKVYLDISTVVNTPEEAERLGKEANQYAYYDLEHGKAVTIESERTHAAKAAAEFDWRSRWAAQFGRPYRARAALDWTRAYAGGDRSRTPHARAAGGVGSGNFGHAGRPGEVGGSASSDAVSSPEIPNGTIDFDSALAGVDEPLASTLRTTMQTLHDLSFGSPYPESIHETLTFVDVTKGATVFPTPIHGLHDGVQIPPYQRAALEVYDDPFSVIPIHTHPSGSAFSPADFAMAAKMGHRGAIVVGKNGDVYELRMNRALKSEELRAIYDDLTYRMQAARTAALNETDEYAIAHGWITADRLAGFGARRDVITAHPELEALHARHWITVMDQTWKTLAAQYKDLLSYRRTPGKAAKTHQAKAAQLRVAERTRGFFLDDTDTFSYYALDGAARRTHRAAGGAGSGNYGHAGRPGEVGGSSPDDAIHEAARNLTLYHGTASDVLDAIKQKGLVPKASPGGDAYAKRYMSSPPEMYTLGDRPVSVFVADNTLDAERFAGLAAKMHPGSEPVILEVRVPLDQAKVHLKEDEFSDQWRYVGTIPPEWISGRVENDDGEITIRPLSAVRTIYLVILAQKKTPRHAAEGELHAAADAHTPRLSVALRYAFATAKKRVRPLLTRDKLRSYEPAVRALRNTLREVLPPRILPMLVDGGRVAAGMLLRTAGGVGSGNFGHAGRPGEVGGSSASSLSDDEKEYLLAYIDVGYEALNLELRTGAIEGHYSSFQRKQRDLLDAIIARHTLQHDTTLYRGMWIKNQRVDTGSPAVSLTPGSTWTDKAYTSTSKDPDQTSSFGDTLVEIEVPKGAHALDINRVLPDYRKTESDLSGTWERDEQEVLLPRNSTFEVIRWDAATNTLKVRLINHFRAAKKRTRAIDFAFDAANQHAIDWADRHAGELIDGIIETTREAISNAVAEYLETGEWDEFVDAVYDAIGDADRADLIARHEPMLAVSEGQRHAWLQAQDAGLLTGEERPVWIVVGDEKVCPVCLGLDGSTRSLDGMYTSEDGEEYPGPPAHVACRCTEGLT